MSQRRLLHRRSVVAQGGRCRRTAVVLPTVRLAVGIIIVVSAAAAATAAGSAIARACSAEATVAAFAARRCHTVASRHSGGVNGSTIVGATGSGQCSSVAWSCTTETLCGPGIGGIPRNGGWAVVCSGSSSWSAATVVSLGVRRWMDAGYCCSLSTVQSTVCLSGSLLRTNAPAKAMYVPCPASSLDEGCNAGWLRHWQEHVTAPPSSN